MGTLFLFVYFPSFNAALSQGTAMQRAYVNTYLSIACSVVAAILISKFTQGGKLDMEIIMCASLAGGVVMGAPATIIVRPFGAMIAGFVTGCAAAFGYRYLNGFLRAKKILHDTAGVFNLHFIPGFAGAITSCIVASYAKENFGDKQFQVPFQMFTDRGKLQYDTERSAGIQAGY